LLDGAFFSFFHTSAQRRKQKEKMENGALASSDDAKHRKEEGASE